MKILTGCVLASLAAILGACASTPKSYMLVPSGSTIGPLEDLSRRPGTVADVYTVNRREQRLLLDGGEGTSLTGHDPDAASVSGEIAEPVRIPFDEVALVYYRAGGRPAQDVYPLLPAVGVAEQRMSCEELNTEIERASTIRWNARQHGAMPFTAHQALAQHGKNALYYAGMTVLVAGAIVGGGFGGSSGSASAAAPDPISFETYRRAVTAADQRVLGLLALKRDRPCTPSDTRIAGETDLSLLAKIEQSRQALVDKHLTDEEQARRQTVLPDQFDPLLTGTEQSDFAVAVRTFETATWWPNVDAMEGVIKVVSHPHWRGTITLTDEELVFRPTTSESARIGGAVRLRYTDISGEFVTAHYGLRTIIGVTRRDGQRDTIEIDRNFGADREAMQALVDFLKSKVSTAPPDER